MIRAQPNGCGGKGSSASRVFTSAPRAADVSTMKTGPIVGPGEAGRAEVSGRSASACSGVRSGRSRSHDGWRSRERPPRCSTSNSTRCAGTAAVRAARAGAWARAIRDRSNWKSARPCSSSAGTSPSSTAGVAPSAPPSAFSSGQAPVTSSPDRARRPTVPSPARHTTARRPSCSVSWARRASWAAGGSRPAVASMGAMRGRGTGGVVDTAAPGHARGPGDSPERR